MRYYRDLDSLQPLFVALHQGGPKPDTYKLNDYCPLKGPLFPSAAFKKA